jgi:hypothetical protein
MGQNDEQEDQKDTININPFFEHLGIAVYSVKQAIKTAILCIKTGIVPVFVSEAGIGKSAAAREIARQLDADLVSFFLAHIEREDLSGIPYPKVREDSEGHKVATYNFLCEDTMHEVIESGKPTLINLDEWNRGEKNVMNAAFTMMEDRKFGTHELPDHIFIMACMNPSQGNYLVNDAENDPAFRRRMCFIGIRPDVAIWMEWAIGPGKIHPDVSGFIQSSHASLVDVASREAGKVSASPASWEKISNLLKIYDSDKMAAERDDTTLKSALGGIIGVGVSEEFIQYRQDNSALIDPMDIIEDYRKRARPRVRRMVKGGRVDALGRATESVALAVITNEPDAAKVTEQLSHFVLDLPEDLVMAFFNKIAGHSQELQKPAYMAALSKEFSQNKDYREALKGVHRARARAEEDAAKDDEEGPAADEEKE